MKRDGAYTLDGMFNIKMTDHMDSCVMWDELVSTAKR